MLLFFFLSSSVCLFCHIIAQNSTSNNSRVQSVWIIERSRDSLSQLWSNSNPHRDQSFSFLLATRRFLLIGCVCRTRRSCHCNTIGTARYSAGLFSRCFRNNWRWCRQITWDHFTGCLRTRRGWRWRGHHRRTIYIADIHAGTGCVFTWITTSTTLMWLWVLLL